MLPRRTACVARHFEVTPCPCAVRPGRGLWCLMPKPTRWPVGVLSSSHRRGQALLFSSLVRLLPDRWRVAMAGRRPPESGHQGVGGISFTVRPWVPEIRPINISRSKMKQGLTWYRLQRLRTALSRHGCAPLASPPPRIELCALELICRDHARDAGTLRH